MKIYLFGAGINEQHWLTQNLVKQGYSVIPVLASSSHKWWKSFIHLSSFLLKLLKNLYCSEKYDIFVFRYDLYAVICSFIMLSFFRKRPVLALNVLLKKKRSLLNRVYGYIYKLISQKKFFYATTNTENFKKECVKTFGFNALRLFVLHDEFSSVIQYGCDYKNCGKTVFCGGFNGRDWKFMFSLASEMPEIIFNFVVPSGITGPSKNLNNVNFYKNMQEDAFYKIMKESSIVCLPLLTDSPAGLLVAFGAALQKKSIIISDNAIIRWYFEKNESAILLPRPSDLEEYRKTITLILHDEKRKRILGSNACGEICQKASPQKYTSDLIKIIAKITRI